MNENQQVVVFLKNPKRKMLGTVVRVRPSHFVVGLAGTRSELRFDVTDYRHLDPQPSARIRRATRKDFLEQIAVNDKKTRDASFWHGKD